MKRRYHERRRMAIEFLGGKCAECGSVENLEIDHKNPKEKEYEFQQLRSLSIDKFWSEIKKCQLLCRKHHAYKSVTDHGHKHATHGTASMYKNNGCRCQPCRDANWAKIKIYRQNKALLRVGEDAHLVALITPRPLR